MIRLKPTRRRIFLLTLLAFLPVIFLNAQYQLNSDDLEEQSNHQASVFTEKFRDNSNGWMAGVYDVVNLDIANGKYLMEGKMLKSRAFLSYVNLSLSDDEDYAISANTTYLSGNKNGAYGLSWGADFQNNYSFKVSPRGYYTLGRRYFGTYKPLIAIQSYSSDKKDVNTRLKVQKKGKKLILFIDDKEVNQVDYEPMNVLQIGFEITGNQKIMFDDLAVSGKGLSLSVNASATNEPGEPQNDTGSLPPSGQKVSMLNSLEGIWVATATEKDDVGSRSRWMSEWIVKGNNLTANYKGMTAMLPADNNWQVRNFRSNGGEMAFQIAQGSWGVSTALDIQITEFDPPVFRGHYAKQYNAAGIVLNYRGAIELRKIMPLYPDPQLINRLVGSWIGQGQQNTEIQGGRPPDFTNRMRIFKDNSGLLLMEFDGKDEDGIPVKVSWIVIYANQIGNRLKMTAYSPKGWCANAGCAVLVDYDMQWTAPDKIEGTFTGVQAQQLIFGIEGTIEFLKR